MLGKLKEALCSGLATGVSRGGLLGRGRVGLPWLWHVRLGQMGALDFHAVCMCDFGTETSRTSARPGRTKPRVMCISQVAHATS